MKQIMDYHHMEYDDRPAIVVTVPGIYTILGEFADYCQGFTLCGAVDVSLGVAVSARADQSVRLFMMPMKDRKRFNMLNLKYRREDRWANYVKGVVVQLQQRGFLVGGFNLTLSGDLLKTEGAMVACAIGLGAAVALRQLYQFDLSLTDCAAIAHAALSSFCHETCRHVLFLAMVYAREGSLILFDLRNRSHIYIPLSLSDEVPYAFMAVESHITPYALQEELASRRRESRKAFDKLRTVFPVESLRDVSDQEVKDLIGVLDEEEKRICIYVLLESSLTREAAKLLAKNDMVQYGKTISKVQAGLRDIFEVTCPEIDWLIKRALETNGCLGASMITACSSGTIMVVLAKESLPAYTARMEEYEHIFGFRPTWSMYRPVGGVRIDS